MMVSLLEGKHTCVRMATVSAAAQHSEGKLGYATKYSTVDSTSNLSYQSETCSRLPNSILAPMLRREYSHSASVGSLYTTLPTVPTVPAAAVAALLC